MPAQPLGTWPCVGSAAGEVAQPGIGLVAAGVRLHGGKATDTGEWLLGFSGSAAAGGLRRTLAAMSDDDNTPPAATAVVPEARTGWSEQDRNTLIITIVGTFAANVSTVILLGAGIAILHLYHRPAWYGLDMLGYAAVGLLAVAFGNFIRRKFGDDNVLRAGGWVVVGAGSLAVLLAMLVLAGLAAGVK